MRADATCPLMARACRIGFELGALLLALAGPASAQEVPPSDAHGMMEWGWASIIRVDELEYSPGEEGRPFGIEAGGWIGGATNRLWFRAEAEQLTTERAGEGEAQLLYGRQVAPYWDALVGVRVDGRWSGGSATRAHVALGLEGLAPYWFEVAPTLFVSDEGDLSARLEASCELLFTQRLIAEPEVELNAALQEVPDWGIGAGLNDIGLGLQLRYEIRREVAPYVGYAWTRRFGGSADFARAAGESISDGAFVAGVRVWR